MPSTLGIVASGAPSFSPLDLSPALWLDAADTSTITELSGSVSQWDDKSGNGYNFTQATGANQPTTGTRTQNGLNVLDFDGSSDFFVGGDILDVLSGGVTMVGVVKMDTTTNIRAFFGKTRAASQAGRYFLAWSATGGFFPSTNTVTALWHGTARAEAANDPGLGARTDTYVWAQRIARASTNTLWRNGSIVATNSTLSGTTSYDTSNQWMIGAYPSTTGTTPPYVNSYLDGYIGEIIVFMRDLTDAEMALVNDYLNTKWAVY